MVSTYLSYRMYTADYARTVKQTLANAQVSREQEYYQQNIGKVTSVDDFLDDQRLYSYAMKAYGLEDMTYAKAFMRKVLESDLTDSSSFARKLSDSRYVAFAQAFNFSTDGTVESGTPTVQDDSDLESLVGLYSEQRTRKGAAIATEADYYQARIGTVTSAKEFVSDSRLFDFALTSFGIDASIASEKVIQSVISGDLSAVQNSDNLAKYQALADAFSFQEDGTLAEGSSAQSQEQITNTIFLNYEAKDAGASLSAASFKTATYNQSVTSLSSVDDLFGNSVTRDYVLTAAGLDPTYVSDSMLRDILTSDLDDAESFANSDPAYAKLAAMFNFNADGLLDEGVAAQSSEQQEETVSAYYQNYEADAVAAEEDSTGDYRSFIGLISSVDDLLNDSRAYTYIMDAFGIDADSVSKATIRQVLTSDPGDASSYANLSRDDRYVALSKAFNFDADGNAKGALQAQYSSAKSDTIARYEATLGEYDYQKAAGEEETSYYSSLIDNVENVDALLADSRALTFLKAAYGLENDSDPFFKQTLRAALTSDEQDPDSFVNQSGNEKYRELARAFNFASDGTVERVELGAVQDPSRLAETQDLFIRQTIEETAGEQSEGVRLALYFQRKAADITSGYSILADKALLEVVTTALGLPDEVANMDTDKLSALIEDRIDLADFQDSDALEKFIGRFASMYDMNNQDTSTSAQSLLLGQTEFTGISEDILTSIQNMYVSS